VRARRGAAEGQAPSITTGVVGGPCRAEVTPWGDVAPWRGDGTLRWFVAADDRWHDPAKESTVRQRRLAGTPVVETRLRVPDGDAVQRVWAAPDRGGVTVVDVGNDSPLPFAVAFSGLSVLTDRPPADVPVRGIALPDDAFVMPVGHHSSIRVGVPHDPRRWSGRSLALLRSDPDAVVRGWTRAVGRAGRLDLPDEALAHEVVAARADLLLRGPVSATADPAGFLLDVAELVRLGEPPADWLPGIVEPVAAIARAGEADVDAALRAARRVAVGAADAVAVADLDRLRTTRPGAARQPIASFSEIARGASAGRFVHDVERRLAAGGDLLPIGIPTAWLGADFEVHGLPTGDASSVSYAVRWHGPRPAVLWEQHGDPITLTAAAVDPVWSSGARAGEALWAAPPRPRRLRAT
jgi:hypothetical protein